MALGKKHNPTQTEKKLAERLVATVESVYERDRAEFRKDPEVLKGVRRDRQIQLRVARFIAEGKRERAAELAFRELGSYALESMPKSVFKYLEKVYT